MSTVSTDRVRLEVSDHVAQVTLTRPEKHNALDFAMFDALIDAAARVRATAGVRAVVITGEGRSFCSGLDFPSVAGATEDGGVSVFRKALGGPVPNYFQQPIHAWLTLPMPVIAAVHGYCLGGGLQLALAADIRIATADAQLALLEAKWGLIPDMAITRTLPRLVGIDVARELIYTSRMISGAEAAQLGLVTRTADDPLAAALALAAEIAERSPDAIRTAKALLDRCWEDADLDAGMRLEADLQTELVGSPNQQAAIAAGLNHTPAQFNDPATK
jgi:enoyl-CoA hydratase/carnithine racemase